MDRTDRAATRVDEMIRGLDRAVRETCPKRCTGGVKEVLEDVVGHGNGFLPDATVVPRPDHYARRLLHRDPEGRYSVVIMTWGKGQATPVHDHAGLWCVECVYEGTIEVTSYDLDGSADAEAIRLERAGSVRAGIGEAGALIPPFEYHRIANAGDATAVTIHVYGGDMEWCHRYEPNGDGTWKRERCALSFDGP